MNTYSLDKDKIPNNL